MDALAFGLHYATSELTTTLAARRDTATDAQYAAAAVRRSHKLQRAEAAVVNLVATLVRLLQGGAMPLMTASSVQVRRSTFVPVMLLSQPVSRAVAPYICMCLNGESHLSPR